MTKALRQRLSLICLACVNKKYQGLSDQTPRAVAHAFSDNNIHYATLLLSQTATQAVTSANRNQYSMTTRCAKAQENHNKQMTYNH